MLLLWYRIRFFASTKMLQNVSAGLLDARGAELGAVLGGGDAVQGAKTLQKTAVIRESARRAGVQHTDAGGNRIAAVLHTQVGQVAVDALQRVLFKYARKVLPARVGVFGQLGHRQLRVGIVGLQVFNGAGDQQAGGRGRRGALAFVNQMAEQAGAAR